MFVVVNVSVTGRVVFCLFLFIFFGFFLSPREVGVHACGAYTGEAEAGGMQGV